MFSVGKEDAKFKVHDGGGEERKEGACRTKQSRARLVFESIVPCFWLGSIIAYLGQTNKCERSSMEYHEEPT